MGPRRTALLLVLAAGQACAQPATPAGSAEPGRRIFVPPPVQWDQSMLGSRPALQQTNDDFYALSGGITFGMSAVELNTRLPAPYSAMSWTALAIANEYRGEVRYFGMPIAAAGPLRMDATACTGARSRLVFLFSDHGLFRLSYRLTADNDCPDINPAAREIFGRYVTIAQSVALSVRYRTGKTEVVDITDPAAGTLVPTRWRQGGT
jgi:hypothetical protein